MKALPDPFATETNEGLSARLRNFVKRARFREAFERLEQDGYAQERIGRLRHVIDGKRVALIGNASSIFGGSYGDEIDAHDVVIRMNKGVIKEESDQGRRTDILGASCNMKWDWVQSNFAPTELLWLTPNLYSMSTSFLLRFGEIVVSPPGLWRELCLELNGARPSSGLIAANLLRRALHPSSIRLFGFDWKATPTFYHANETRLGPHVWDAEATLVRSWTQADPRLTIAETHA